MFHPSNDQKYLCSQCETFITIYLGSDWSWRSSWAGCCPCLCTRRPTCGSTSPPWPRSSSRTRWPPSGSPPHTSSPTCSPSYTGNLAPRHQSRHLHSVCSLQHPILASSLSSNLVEVLGRSPHWAKRQTYAVLCGELIKRGAKEAAAEDEVSGAEESEGYSPSYFSTELLPHLLDLTWDKVHTFILQSHTNYY